MGGAGPVYNNRSLDESAILYTPQNVEMLGIVKGLRLGELSRFTAVEAS